MTTAAGIWDESNQRCTLLFDTLVTTDSTRLGRMNKSAIFGAGTEAETCIVVAGPVTAILALQSLARDSELLWRTTLEVYESFNVIHSELKTLHGLNTSEGMEGEAFESSQFSALVGNSYGLWSMLSGREIIQADQFAACGSGREFALGALGALSFSGAIEAKHALLKALAVSAMYDKNTGSETSLWKSHA